MPATKQIEHLHDIRRANMRQLISTWGGSTSLALRLGHSNGSYLAQIAGPRPVRTIGEKAARGIEQQLGLPEGWLDSHEGHTQPVDDALLARCVQAVVQTQRTVNVTLQPAKFAETVSAVYEHAAAAGSCDERFVQALVRIGR